MAYGALGGGTFLTQNEVLPGAYINYISVPRASNLFTDRGYTTIGLDMDWGPEKEVMIIEPVDLQTQSLELLGYSYVNQKLQPIREIMQGAKRLYLYRLNSDGEKAKVTIGETLTVYAKYEGIRGNDIKILIENSIDLENGYEVSTYIDEEKVDEQTVLKATELVDNNFVNWEANGDALSTTAGTNLEGGTNGKVTGQSHSSYIEEIEKYDFNTLGYAGDDDVTKSMYVEFTRRMRDNEGVKFQTVLYNLEPRKANYEGIINVKNAVLDNEDYPGSLVYWVTGQEAGIDINRSITNKEYTGDYAIDTNYKKREIVDLVEQGFFVMYERNQEIRVLEDINSFTEFTLYKNEDFSKNQIIRVLDQRAKDISIIFNKRYLGKVQNNEDGRIALWNELVKHAETLTQLGAIEDYDSEDTTVEKGYEKDAVVIHDFLMPVMAMQKLYMTIHVR